MSLPPHLARFAKRPDGPLNLTAEEIDAIARVLIALGGVKDRDRRIDVAAMAIKIAICEEDNPRWGPLRAAAGIEEHVS